MSPRYYVCEVTCSNSGLSATTPEFALPIQTAFAGGVFTIDNTLPAVLPNFVDFTSCINYLNSLNTCGAFTGPATVNVAAGQEFNETPPALTASGSLGNLITFQRAGVGANPVVRPVGTATANEGGITLLGCDFVTFDGIDVQQHPSSNLLDFGYAVKNQSATNAANNNTIKNCAITLNRTNTTTVGLICTSSTTGGGFTPTAASGSNSNNKFYNLTIQNCIQGVNVISGTTTWPGIGNEVGVEGGGTTTIGAPYVGIPTGDIGGGSTAPFGIQMATQSDFKIFGCTIQNIATTANIARGILISNAFGTCEVRNNRIRGIRNAGPTSTSVVEGINAGMTTLTGAHFLRIYNNFISDITSGYTSGATSTRVLRGIVVGTGNTTSAYEMDFNTVVIDGSGSPNVSSICLESITTATATSFRIRNNILANLTGAQAGVAKHYCIRSIGLNQLGSTTLTVCNYNDHYLANTTNGFVGLTSATDQATIANWTAALTINPGTDLNSVSINPQFVDATTGDLRVLNGALNDLGNMTGISWVTTDIEGDVRSLTTPDMGADEFATCTGTPVAGTITGVPSVCAGTGTTLNLNGATVQAGISYQWAFSTTPGGPYTNLGTALTQPTGPVPVDYYYIVTVSCAGGSSATTTEYLLDAAPTPTASASNNGPVCPGATINLTGTTDIGATFNWNGPNGYVSTAQSPSITNVTSATAGTYTFTATLGICTSAPSTTIVFIDPEPTIESLTATPNPICVNGSSQLQVIGSAPLPQLLITEVTLQRVGTGATNPYPGYLDVAMDDFIEISNASAIAADIGGWTIYDYPSNSAVSQHPPFTFPPGTILPPFGTVAIGMGPGTNSPANNYYTMGGTNNWWGSTSLVGIVLKDDLNVVQDVVPCGNFYIFAAGTGVTVNDWSGGYAIITSGHSGTKRTAADDNDLGSDWTSSGNVGGTLSLGTYNGGYNSANNVPTTLASWSPATFLSATNIGNPMANAVSTTTTYTATVTSAAGCSTSGTLVLETGNALGASITVTPANATVCDGNTVDLESLVTGGGAPYSYDWSDGMTTLSTSDAFTYNPPDGATTLVTLTVLDACGATATASVSVTSLVNPTTSVNASSAAYCSPGPGVILTASGADTYSWTPGTGLSATTGAVVTATPAAGTTYTVTGTALNGCSTTATVNIGVSPSPVLTGPTATPNVVCEGSNSQLNAVATLPGYILNSVPYAPASPAGPVNPGPSGDDVVSAQFNIGFPFLFYGTTYTNFYISTNGFITLGTTAPGSGCCSGQLFPSATVPNNVVSLFWEDLNTTVGGTIDYFNLTSPNRLVIRFNAVGRHTASGVCDGQMILYEGGVIDMHINSVTSGASDFTTQGIENANGTQALVVPGRNSAVYTISTPECYRFQPNQATYSWSPPTFLSDPAIGNPVATAMTSSQTYTVTATSSSGCAVSGSIAVTVNPAPVVTAGSYGPACSTDGPIQLAGSPPGGLWSGNGVVGNEFYPVVGTSTLTYSYFDGNCQGTDQTTITVNQATFWYFDGDLDGFGDPFIFLEACVQPPGFVANNTDLCDADPLKQAPGQCGCNVPDTDSDGDATADCVDLCPLDPNKIDPGFCGCGNPETDTDSDGFPDCVDLCPLDPNKFDPGQCGCGNPDTDSDFDGIADCLDPCPLLAFVNVGDPCDDGLFYTINDEVNANCECVGTFLCTLNSVTLELTTDGAATETSWDIIPEAGGSPLCSGSGYPNSQLVTEECCLPDGCYSLRVFDSFGDGMCCAQGPGGYVLRDGASQRIIDNAGDGSFGFLSQVALGFCLPLSTDALMPASCDIENALPATVLVIVENTDVTANYSSQASETGYQFWFYNPDGGYTRRIFQSHSAPGSSWPIGTANAQKARYMRLNFTTNPLPQLTLLNVRVRSRINGVYANFGPACRLKLDPTSSCVATQLTTTNNPVISCGASGITLDGTPNATVWADEVPGANLYQFEFSRPGQLRRVASSNRSLVIGTYLQNPLVCGVSYDVRVRSSFDSGNTWCAYGSVCVVNMAPCNPAQGGRVAADEEAGLSLFPNPNRGDQVIVRLTGLGDEEQLVTIEVVDLFGKRVITQTVPAAGLLNTTLDLNGNLASGMYMVNVTAGEATYSQRLVIQ